ncbi:MAG: sensor histidine kinase [Janthinobacterium lividum]
MAPPSTVASATRGPSASFRPNSARAQAPVQYSPRAYLLIALAISVSFALLVLPTAVLARPHTTIGQAGLLFLNPACLFGLLFGVNYLLRYRPSHVQRWLSLQPMWTDRWLRAAVTFPALASYVGVRYYLDQTLRIHLESTSLLVQVLMVVLATAVGFSFQIGIELAESGRHLTQQVESLKREQLQARYDSLKQQLSPHFLFNSLSTLSGLVYEEPAAAEQFIEQMAQVYRYLLRHGEQAAVPLREELAFVRSYTYLLQMRFGEGLALKIDLPEEVLDRQLPPLALQLLVENAVKHNTLSVRRPLAITIDLAAPDQLRVCNPRHPRLTLEASSGTGLHNLTNRIRLLNRQRLLVEQTDAEFCVLLPLPA